MENGGSNVGTTGGGWSPDVMVGGEMVMGGRGGKRKKGGEE